jgi:hypothetical protein
MQRRHAFPALFAFAFATAAGAGTYNFVETQQPVNFEPFRVVHPVGYTGGSGVLTIEICTTQAAQPLIPYLDAAIATWNALSASTGNCSGPCRVVDETNPMPPGIFQGDITSGILHELGHCAMGLGHNNYRTTSYSNSKRYPETGDVTFQPGNDGIRGSFDDVVLPSPGARILHWFRLNDNNPVVVDGTPIDINTFTRALSSLPVGHNWPANANLYVAGSLGAPNTQSIMVSKLGIGAVYSGPTADDVSTIKFAMAGLNETIGGGDDYTLQLVRIANCTGAEVEVDFSHQPGDPQNFVGVWNFLLLLQGDFETGDTSQWSSTTP